MVDGVPLQLHLAQGALGDLPGRHNLPQRLLALADILGDGEEAGEGATLIAQRAQRDQHGQPAAVLADIGPLVFVGLVAAGPGDQGVEVGRHFLPELSGE